MGNQSPPTNPLETIPPAEQVPSSSTDDIWTRMDQFEQRQDQILTELQ